MAVSLNAINQPISYDTRIDYYIDLYKFAGEFILSFRLPILLSSLNECYCVESSEESFQSSLLKGIRRVVIAGTRNWISEIDKEKPKDLSIKNADCFTSLVIAIEIKKEEIPACIAMFSKDPSELTYISEEILQNALEVALYRYNEKANGASFLVPSYADCDRVDIGLVVNYIEKRFHRCHFIPFHFPLIGVSETPIDKEAFASEIHNWRYFYSKAKDDYKTKKYIDSIISSAISIESYAWETVSAFCNNQTEVEEYTTELNEAGEKCHLSATRLYKKLNNDRKIATKLSNSQLEKYVQKILNPRNDIMHGKKSVALPWGEIAKKVQSYLDEFYVKLNESIDTNMFLERTSHDEDIQYRDYVLKCRNHAFRSLEEKQRESEAVIARAPQMELPRIQLIQVYLEAGLLQEAEDAICSFFRDCSDPCTAAVDLCPTFIKTKNLDLGIKLFMRIKDLDSRASVAMALLYFAKYREERNSEYLKKAYCLSKNASFLGTKYILADIICREIASEMGLREYVEALSKQLVHSIPNDYWFPLCCAEYTIDSKDYSSAVVFLNTFIERFSKSTHAGLKIDYYGIKLDTSGIEKRVSSILSSLEQVGLLSSIQEESIKLFEDSLKKERTGYLVVTDISSKARGSKMPMGNLLYKEIPFYPDGYYIHK